MRSPLPRHLALASLLLAAAASACGGTVAFDGVDDGTGGAGGDGPPVASGPVPDGPGPVGPVGAGGNGPGDVVSVGPGGGAGPTRCSLVDVFEDPTCDACALTWC